jgi:hypothetical protein
MEYPSVIEKIILKEGATYEELRDIVINTLQEVDQEVWEIDMNILKFPVPLNENEIFEFIEFLFLQEYDKAVYVHIFPNENNITIECDKCFEGSMLALISILFIGVIVFMIIALK